MNTTVEINNEYFFRAVLEEIEIDKVLARIRVFQKYSARHLVSLGFEIPEEKKFRLLMRTPSLSIRHHYLYLSGYIRDQEVVLHGRVTFRNKQRRETILFSEGLAHHCMRPALTVIQDENNSSTWSFYGKKAATEAECLLLLTDEERQALMVERLLGEEE